MKQLCIVYCYDYHGDRVAECITDDFRKWLERNNQELKKAHLKIRTEEDFSVENVEFVQFNK